jgi:hypothetical protein
MIPAAANELPAESPQRSDYTPLPPKARRVADACSALGISRATLYKLSLQGKVKLVKIAGRTVVPDELELRITAERVTARSSPRRDDAGGPYGRIDERCPPTRLKAYRPAAEALREL